MTFDPAFGRPPWEVLPPKRSRRRTAIIVTVSVLGTVLLLLAIAAALLARFHVPDTWRTYRITSDSMANTLRPGQVVRVASDRSPRRGDVVLMHVRAACLPNDQDCGWTSLAPSGGGSDLIFKRIVAVAGDTIACPPTGMNATTCGQVELDGKPIDEPYLFDDDHKPFGPVTVPPGGMYVLGDHRSDSRDSRYEGVAAIASVAGRVSSVRG